MPSMLHGGLLDLFRRAPDLAPRLLREGLHVDVPPHRVVEVARSEFTQLAPTEYRADLVLTLRDEEKPVFGIVLEVQLQADPEKKRTWPLYQAALYAHLGCETCVLVVTTDPGVAAWAGQRIVTGPDAGMRPLVLYKGTVPRVTDPAQARRSPELAVLSSLEHGNDQGGVEVVLAALGALTGLDDEYARFCYDWIVASLGEATRKALEEVMKSGTYEYQTEFARKYVAIGRAEGKAHTLLHQLTLKFGPLPQALATKLSAFRDGALLDTLLERVLTANRLEEMGLEDIPS